MKKRPCKVDVAVALVFFVRPEQLKVVFDKVKEAAPSKLFLIQDGAREGKPSDQEKIEECRKIVDNIDWECEVFKNYSDTNLGCGKRIYSGIKWAFEKVEHLIILEDDCVPALSFFSFCEELLEKYKDDLRIGLISGMNHMEKYERSESDYFFANVGSIAGWATWKRCWDAMDYELALMDNHYNRDIIKVMSQYGPQRYKHYLDSCEKRREILFNGGKLSSWSFQFGLGIGLNSQIIIVPKYNQMTNIGAVEGSTNSATDARMTPRAIRRIYELGLFELDFPLKHPKYVVPDYYYDKLVDDMMRPAGLKRIGRKLESIFLRLRYGDFGGLWRALKRRVFKRK